MSKFAAKLKADGYAGGGAVAPDDGSILTPGFRSVLSALKQRFSPAIDAQMPGALSNDEYEARFHDNINSGKYVPQMGRSAAKAAQPFVNVPAQLARGWVAGTAGLPGDLESLARTVNNLMTPEGSRSQRMDEHSTLPTSEFYRDWLPGKDDSPLGSLAGSVGNLAGGVGAQRAAQGVQKAATLSRGALGALADAAASSTGRMGRAGQLGAVRVRGGNFNDFSLDNYLNDTMGIDGMPMGAADHPVGQWARTQLRNYLRKDMGSPNDPLLQVEKELPNMHLQEDLPGEHDSAMRAQRVNRVIDAINDNQRGTYLDPRSGYTKHARAHMALTNGRLHPGVRCRTNN
jgi:hypothetical protein